jgi:hypothetical protein
LGLCGFRGFRGFVLLDRGGACLHQMQNGMPFNRAFVRDADGFLLEFLQRGNQ